MFSFLSPLLYLPYPTLCYAISFSLSPNLCAHFFVNVCNTFPVSLTLFRDSIGCGEGSVETCNLDDHLTLVPFHVLYGAPS